MILFDNQTYRALRNGMDMAWMQQQVHSNNIANSETPNYKNKTIEFKKVLQKVENGQSAKWVQKAVITSDESTASRPDGNNVNTEQEELGLWQAYAQYSALTQRLSGKLSTLSYVINNTAK